MKSLVIFFLTTLARLTLARFRPVIIGITGNAGKTTTKDAIVAVLAGRYRLRATGGNMNNEFGMPATIIGDFAERYYTQGGTPLFWLGVFWQGFIGLFASRASYPEMLVLEYGADRPGDIAMMARRFRPTVGVVTRIGEIPVHVEFFASPQHLADEKAQLIKALPTDGMAVLNFDDQTVLDMRHMSTAPVTTFGFAEGADIRATGLEIRLDGARPTGIGFTLSSGGPAMPVVVRGTVGRGIAAAAMAAVAVGRRFSIGLADAVDALSRMALPPGRMRVIAGIKDTTIIDDTYNASPAAVHLALDGIHGLPGRKVVVLGDMRELGEHTVQAHEGVGHMAGAVAHTLVCVGESARFMADAASHVLTKEQIHWYPDSRTAAPEVQKLLKPGDVVLVKGSQGMRMERIVLEVMGNPQEARKFLVRQSTLWQQK